MYTSVATPAVNPHLLAPAFCAEHPVSQLPLILYCAAPAEDALAGIALLQLRLHALLAAVGTGGRLEGEGTSKGCAACAVAHNQKGTGQL